MSHCPSCGRESPPSYQFCLSCGTKLSRADGQTPAAAEALPESIHCQHCGTRNDPGMHYCSHCGRAIGLPTMAAPGSGPVPAAPPGHAAAAPPALATRLSTAGSTPQPRTRRPTPAPGTQGVVPEEPQRPCPHCGGQTPIGYRFCQRCGKPLADSGPAPRPAVQPADSGATARAARWGTLVCLNRDGSQGAEYPLTGESIDIGSESQIRFADPFLAPRHLRLERSGSRVSLTPLDRTNGVFVRAGDQIALEDGAVLLLGRELLRFELLEAAEREIRPAIQHGVRVFGSPVRDAWGRLLQLLPDACVRDVRHLVGAEIIIGREDGDLIFPDDEFLSRRHASLHWRDGTCHLQDLGSSNGSFLRVAGPTQLHDGAQLRFGDQMVRIDLTAAGAVP